jgi:hypothetical protein
MFTKPFQVPGVIPTYEQVGEKQEITDTASISHTHHAQLEQQLLNPFIW